uniref:Intercellular adhesion molecule 1-like n=1 Tax=Haplochromis burtoni TaxID=8153 RepID=A0A3Q2WDJ1_HAPBU
MLENTNSLNITPVNRNTTCTCTAPSILGNITKTFYVHAEPRGTHPSIIKDMLRHDNIRQLLIDPIQMFLMWKSKCDSGTCKLTLLEMHVSCTDVIMLDIKFVSDMGHVPMVEGREHDLKCDVISVAPVQILTVTWYRGNETVLTETFNESTAIPVNASSTLKISTQRDYNGLTFRCEAELHLGPKGPKFLPNTSSPPYTAVVLCKISTHVFHVFFSTSELLSNATDVPLTVSSNA